MRAALLISGYLRSFDVNINNIKNKILNNLDSCDVYIHITLNEKQEDKYLNNYEIEKALEQIKNILNPKNIIIENNSFFEQNLQKNNIFNLWNKFYKLNMLKKANEEIFGTYDIVIKTRPDLCLLNEINFSNCLEQKIYIPKDTKLDKNKLKNISDNYICDTFAFGPSHLMDKYFIDYEKLHILTDMYGNISETLLYHHLQTENIPYNIFNIDYAILLSKCNIFGICGDSGSGKSTLANILKKFFSNSFLLEGDRYHKWERNDSKWKEYTHLNPEANYIAKMSSDIFDLKIGKNIYQVDYDHKNGKFTERELIESSENIIVCGLHSLYVDNPKLYDIKIYMDTEEELKHKWKIERDVNKRDYSLEKILKQIEDRKNDYYKFIVPQKSKSDIIIKFFETNKELRLKLSIQKKYPIDLILDILNKNKINFIFDTDLNFNNFTFMEYQKNNLLGNEIIKLNDYYEYIIFFILNLNKE
jgi:uridine kinase